MLYKKATHLLQQAPHKNTNRNRNIIRLCHYSLALTHRCELIHKLADLTGLVGLQDLLVRTL